MLIAIANDPLTTPSNASFSISPQSRIRHFFFERERVVVTASAKLLLLYSWPIETRARTDESSLIATRCPICAESDQIRIAAKRRQVPTGDIAGIDAVIAFAVHPRENYQR